MQGRLRVPDALAGALHVRKPVPKVIIDAAHILRPDLPQTGNWIFGDQSPPTLMLAACRAGDPAAGVAAWQQDAALSAHHPLT
jgi:hypothetical protein